MPLLRSLKFNFGDDACKYAAAKRLRTNAMAHVIRLSYFPRSTILLISAFAWFMASSAESSPLFAFER